MIWVKQWAYLGVLLLLVQCRAAPPTGDLLSLSREEFLNKVHGAWQAIMVANHTGLLHQGLYLERPGQGDRIDLALLEQWSTDDDTMVEWVYIDLMERHGLDPTYAQIRQAWVDHLNHDLWVSTRRARELMDEGYVPPDTGSARLNPEGVWSIDAQLQTELFGLIAPGMPQQAAERARFFARVTNSGLAVDVSAFYATLYALAYGEPDVQTLIAQTQIILSDNEEVNDIVDHVVAWHKRYPEDWRESRRLIAAAYDTDPEWWASKVNFASTIMALLYGDGELMRTLTIASLSGWDADNNATTSAGLIGLIVGYDALPAPIGGSSDIYFNEDVTGELPKVDSVREIARRTQALAERQIVEAGGDIVDGMYFIAAQHP